MPLVIAFAPYLCRFPTMHEHLAADALTVGAAKDAHRQFGATRISSLQCDISLP